MRKILSITVAGLAAVVIAACGSTSKLASTTTKTTTAAATTTTTDPACLLLQRDWNTTTNLLQAKNYKQAAASYQNLGGDFSGIGLVHDAKILTTFGSIVQGISYGAGTPTQAVNAIRDFEFLVPSIQRDVEAKCHLRITG